MFLLPNLSLKQRLSILMGTISFLTLVLASVAFLTYERIALRNSPRAR